MFRDRGHKSRKTLMHYAAELGFLHINVYFQEALKHPVVRMLIKTKWKSYGHLFLR